MNRNNNDGKGTSKKRIRVIRNTSVPTIYVEGICQMLVGFPNSRLLLSNLVQKDSEDQDADGETVHTLACELIIPTSAIIEITQGILRNLAQNSAMLKKGGQEWIDNVQKIVETLEENGTTERSDK